MSIPTATVTMAVRGEERREAGFGDGMVDATYKTIASMVGTNSELVRYQVNAITGGTDAQGVVSVTIKEGSSTATGKGAHTDIIMASALAYINALNRIERMKARKAASPLNP
jgi:2-isopropylmalate synthase